MTALPPDAPPPALPRALEGVRVLDLSRVLAGPWSTQILADLGADVAKIELPGGGDDTRAWGPPFLTGADGQPEQDTSAYYLSANRNKRSAAINLSRPEGAQLIRDMARHADIVVENFKVGGLARYGLDYATLSALNPRLVYCSITGFGQTGPYAERAGYDFVAQGMGGFMSITGETGGGGLKAGVAMADLATGMYATVSILAALRHAERTGEGQHIDVSLLDTQIAMLANQAMNWLVGGIVPGRMGNRHPSIVPYRTFDAADGEIIIAVGNDRQFRALCDVLGLDGVAEDARFARASARVVHRDAIEAIVQDAVHPLTRAALMDRFVPAGVPAGPVNSVRDVFEDDFATARGAVHRFTRDDGVAVPTLAFPAKLSRTPADYRTAPPRVGEQTRGVLSDWLGLDAAALDALIARGVVATPPGT